MRDRLKFRVWSKRECKYVEYHLDDDLTFAIDIDGKLIAYASDYSDHANCDEGDFYDSHMVEQCTGLKDTNGKLIYEGDIVEDEYGCKYIVKFGKHTITIPVGYENGETECWGWYLSKFTYGFIYLQEQCDNLNPDNEYLIIGNIHENPELS